MPDLHAKVQNLVGYQFYIKLTTNQKSMSQQVVSMEKNLIPIADEVELFQITVEAQLLVHSHFVKFGGTFLLTG